MLTIITPILIYGFCVQVLSFDIVQSEIINDMIEDGRNQYQLLQERGKLPRYGECWTAAVEHIHEGCRYLTEDMQSDIALRITNCFLEMSGHETYNCDRDKKPNLRGICISSMSDRAFNVYTEFYTHAQNICWFLRGQVWQEKISERTFQVGEQLKTSVGQQQVLLEQQKKSLKIQQQLLDYGNKLETVLNYSRTQAENIMEEIKLSTVQHQKLLSLMSNSLSGLQAWLIGEISWFDSLVFYIGGSIIIVGLTSVHRTENARLPLLFTLSMNIILERIICDKIHLHNNIQITHENLYKYIWYCRNSTVILCILILLVQIYCYRDYIAVNNGLLLKIQQQNLEIKEELQQLKCTKRFENKFNIIRESPSVEPELVKPSVTNYFKTSDSHSETSKNSSFTEIYSNTSRLLSRRSSVSTSRECLDNSLNNYLNLNRSIGNISMSSIHRYNLRRRPETPSQ